MLASWTGSVDRCLSTVTDLKARCIGFRSLTVRKIGGQGGTGGAVSVGRRIPGDRLQHSNAHRAAPSCLPQNAAAFAPASCYDGYRTRS